MTAPLSYLSAAGPAARPVLALDWGLIAISSAVILIVSGLLLVAVLKRRKKQADPAAIATESPSTQWITIGVSISIVTLVAATIWMLLALHAVREPEGQAAIRIDVKAEQFWWSFQYAADDRGPAFTTADEIHIPIGKPIHLNVTSGDVIHSFWVPKLAGKTDTIPGQINETWFQADQTGIYRGQCGEFCGLEHGGMGFNVIADTPDDFLIWRRHQLESPGDAPALKDAATAFATRCGSCHAVRGTTSDATIAPNLSHIASRARLASGVLPNDEASMRTWLRDPNAVKPGTSMPKPGLSDAELDAIVSYVTSLK